MRLLKLKNLSKATLLLFAVVIAIPFQGSAYNQYDIICNDDCIDPAMLAMGEAKRLAYLLDNQIPNEVIVEGQYDPNTFSLEDYSTRIGIADPSSSFIVANPFTTSVDATINENPEAQEEFEDCASVRAFNNALNESIKESKAATLNNMYAEALAASGIMGAPVNLKQQKILIDEVSGMKSSVAQTNKYYHVAIKNDAIALGDNFTRNKGHLDLLYDFYGQANYSTDGYKAGGVYFDDIGRAHVNGFNGGAANAEHATAIASKFESMGFQVVNHGGDRMIVPTAIKMAGFASLAMLGTIIAVADVFFTLNESMLNSSVPITVNETNYDFQAPLPGMESSYFDEYGNSVTDEIVENLCQQQ